jgi:hypothetical protein
MLDDLPLPWALAQARAMLLLLAFPDRDIFRPEVLPHVVTTTARTGTPGDGRLNIKRWVTGQV